jgi:hypothetical protein
MRKNTKVCLKKRKGNYFAIKLLSNADYKKIVLVDFFLKVKFYKVNFKNKGK